MFHGAGRFCKVAPSRSLIKKVTSLPYVSSALRYCVRSGSAGVGVSGSPFAFEPLSGQMHSTLDLRFHRLRHCFQPGPTWIGASLVLTSYPWPNPHRFGNLIKRNDGGTDEVSGFGSDPIPRLNKFYVEPGSTVAPSCNSLECSPQILVHMCCQRHRQHQSPDLTRRPQMLLSLFWRPRSTESKWLHRPMTRSRPPNRGCLLPFHSRRQARECSNPRLSKSKRSRA